MLKLYLIHSKESDRGGDGLTNPEREIEATSRCLASLISQTFLIGSEYRLFIEIPQETLLVDVRVDPVYHYDGFVESERHEEEYYHNRYGCSQW